MATTLCFINQKGGCGKSSTCFHLSGCLAELGFEVLLVDADPQGSLSQAFFGSAEIERLTAEETLAVLFDDGCHRASVDLITLPTSFERISLIPANHTLTCPQFAIARTGGAQATDVACPPGTVATLRCRADRLPAQPVFTTFYSALLMTGGCLPTDRRIVLRLIKDSRLS